MKRAAKMPTPALASAIERLAATEALRRQMSDPADLLRERLRAGPSGTAASGGRRVAKLFGDSRGMERVVKVLPASQQPAADLAYWLSRPMAERIAAVEALRMQTPEHAAHAEPRLQRVCRVAQRQRR
jgi:hypothetical protein